MEHRVVVAWILIALGSVILLNQIDLFNLNTPNIIALISLAWGSILLVRSWKHPIHKGILGGTFFILLSLTIVLMQFNYFPLNDVFAIGIIFINLGIAHLVYFAVRKTKVSNLIFAIVFILIGIPLVAYEYYYISFWEIQDIFSTYWPILLILIGVGFLGEGLIKHYKRQDKELSKTA